MLSVGNVNAADALIVRRSGILAYEPVWAAMRDFTQERDDATPDEIWLLQHTPVFTQGQAGKAEHLLAPGDIPVVQVDRGGQVTYHGPGQLMAYLLLQLTRLKIGARDLVSIIEDSIVSTLAHYDIKAKPRKDAPGVYVENAKIASLGLRIKRGCSFHGLALNIDMDLEPFHRINPCGFQGLRMAQIKDFVPTVTVDAVADVWLANLTEAVGYSKVVEKRGLPGDE